MHLASPSFHAYPTLKSSFDTTSGHLPTRLVTWTKLYDPFPADGNRSAGVRTTLREGVPSEDGYARTPYQLLFRVTPHACPSVFRRVDMLDITYSWEEAR